MTLTLNLPPDAEAVLHRLASEEGEEESPLATRLLTTLLLEEETDFHQAAAAVGRALADLDSGERGMLLEDYRAEVEARRRTPQSAT